jgi:hypothetical protein
MRKLKELKQGEQMPYDFWNYDVNPILGYKFEKYRKNSAKEINKYGMIPISKKL